jgi:anti-sigma B factor antagonist
MRTEILNNLPRPTPLKHSIVRFSGDLDSAKRAYMQRVLDRLNADVVVIDLTGTSFLDAEALGYFVRLRNRLRENRRLGSVRIVVPDPRLRRLFEITCLTKIFDLYYSLDSALIARP